MMRTLLSIALLMALATPRSVAAPPAPITIDVLLPLTGAAAYSGITQQQAARVYETIVNKTGGIHGAPLHFAFYDDHADPKTAVQLVNELLPQHPTVILGPTLTATCAAVAPLFANGDGPVNYCLSPSLLPPHGGNVFASAVTLHNAEMWTYNHAKAMGFKRYALIAATDASGLLSLQYIREWATLPANTEVQIVDVEAFAPSDLSVAAQVANIKAANPDIIFIYAIGTAFGSVLRELTNAGLSGVVTYTTPANASVSQLGTYHDFLPKTLLSSGMPYQGKLTNQAMKAAATEYLGGIHSAGVKFDPMQSYAWDPIKITLSALRALPPGATAAQLHAYLENLHDFAGLWGVYDFRTGDQHGLDGRDSVFLTFDAATTTWEPYSGP